jgi:hypothetical protein
MYSGGVVMIIQENELLSKMKDQRKEDIFESYNIDGIGR